MDLNILLDWFKHYNYVCIPIFAFIIDTIIGDPNSKFHPVALIGRVISFYEAVFYKDTDNDTKKTLVWWYYGWLYIVNRLYHSLITSLDW